MQGVAFTAGAFLGKAFNSREGLASANSKYWTFATALRAAAEAGTPAKA
jgi:hypothetical protein